MSTKLLIGFKLYPPDNEFRKCINTNMICKNHQDIRFYSCILVLILIIIRLLLLHTKIFNYLFLLKYGKKIKYVTIYLWFIKFKIKINIRFRI